MVVLKGYIVLGVRGIFLKLMLHYLTSPNDINIYFTHMHREGTVVTVRSTLCHGVNLVLDLNQEVLKFILFLSTIFQSLF